MVSMAGNIYEFNASATVTDEEPNEDFLFSGSFVSGNLALDTFRNVCEYYSENCEFTNVDGEPEPEL